jgi:hypothetical protein
MKKKVIAVHEFFRKSLRVCTKKERKTLPAGCVTWQGSVIVSPTANLKASDLDTNIGSFLFTTWLPAKAVKGNERNIFGIFDKKLSISKQVLLENKTFPICLAFPL